MAAPTIKTRVPGEAKKGEVVEIKTAITHEMESGQRKAKDGTAIPRKIINRFVATFNDREVFASDWQPAVAANPYLAFFLKVQESGTLKMTWIDDDGSVYEHSAEIKAV